MAGSGAKVIYPRNTNDNPNKLANIYGGNITSYNSSSVGVGRVTNMEDELVQQLREPTSDRRLRALEELRSSTRRNGGRFPYQNQRRVFDALTSVLADNKHEVRMLCVQLLHEIIPSYADRGNLDECMLVVLPRLVPNLADPTITFRRQVIQTLHVYMKYTNNVQELLKAIVQYGLEYPDARVKKEVIVALPMLFTPEFSQENFFEIAQSLAKRLLDSNLGEDSTKQLILFSMEKIQNLVGDTAFNGYIQRLSTPLRKYYLKLINKESFQNDRNSTADRGRGNNPKHANGHISSDQSAFQYSPETQRHNFYSSGGSALEFGVVSSHVMDKLNDQTNFRTRAQAVEELKVILRDLDKQGVEALSPHVLSLISFLNNMLDDSNFKITTVTLEILGILVKKLGVGIRAYLKPHVACLTKRMGDNKIVIRQTIMKVCIQLMQLLTPKPVVAVITENLSNRNSRVRQETLNIIIASLLTFPSYDFDLGMLCDSIAHTLVDPKRQVRQAALECFAVIAAAMGAGKLQPLVGAVDGVELSYEGDGVMAAVQARLTRRQLPKLNADGLVDYAMSVPGSGTARGTAATPTGPDIDWILQGSVSSGSSARSTRSDKMDLESVTSSARSTPANFIQESPSHGATPRRHPSAGKNRARLPWEDEQYGEGAYSNRQAPSAASDPRDPRSPAVKPRTTWGGDDFGNDAKRQGKKKAHGGSAGSTREPSPEPGSYRHIHMSKYRRSASDGATSSAGTPTYSVYSGNKEGDMDVDYDPNDPGRLDNGRYDGRPASLPPLQETDATYDLDPQQGQGRQYYDQQGRDPEYYDPRHASDDPQGRDYSPRDCEPQQMAPQYPECTTSGPQEAHRWLPETGVGSPVRARRRAKPSEQGSPIPTKPSLARSVSSKRKVPPIPIDGSRPSARDDTDAMETGHEEDEYDRRQMRQSVVKIRNSASKKKVDKLFSEQERLESATSTQRSSRSSRSPSPSQSAVTTESGIYSGGSRGTNRTGGAYDSPFETKPRLVRTPTLDRQPEGRGADRGTQGSPDYKPHGGEYKPHGGVTFLKNPSADVAIVGKGYSDHGNDGPGGANTGAGGNKGKERARKQSKSVLSPLGMASMHGHGQADTDDDKGPGGVVGRGMFDHSSSDTSLAPGVTPAPRERRTSRSDVTAPSQPQPPRGVIGVRVRNNSQDLEYEDSDEGESAYSDDTDDDVASMSMSKSTREKLEKKFRQKQEEAERERQQEERERIREERERQKEERERQKEERERQREAEQRLKDAEKDRLKEAEKDRLKEAERQRQARQREADDRRKGRDEARDRLRKLSGPQEEQLSDMAITGSSQKGSTLNNNSEPSSNGVPARKPPNKDKPVQKRKTKPSLDGPPSHPGSASKAGEIEPPENLMPFSDPGIKYNEAMKLLQHEDWESKCAGIAHIRRLALHHPELVIPNLHAVNQALMMEVRNLRSAVSRLAIVCLGDMFAGLKRSMEVDLDKVTMALLTKNGESNNFIRAELEQTLNALCNSVTPTRGMVAILNTAASHKNVAVRKVAALYMAVLVERLGAQRTLTSQKEVTERVLPIAAQYMQDPNPEIRYYGQKIFHLLMSCDDFDRVVSKALPVTTLRNIQDKLDNLRRKGLGEPPVEASSARTRRSGHGTRNTLTRGVSNTSSSSVAQTSASSRRPAGGASRANEPSPDDLKAISDKMAAADWRDRQAAVQRLVEVVQSHPTTVANNINKVFDRFIPLLRDSNAKLNLYALTSLGTIVPALGEHLAGVVPLCLQTVASNVASKNPDIQRATTAALDTFMDTLDASVLLPPFVSLAMTSNARVKPAMIERVSFLSVEVHGAKRQKDVTRLVLPLLWSLLGAAPSSGVVQGASVTVREATSALVCTLYSLLGAELVNTARAKTSPANLAALTGIIERECT